uniref:Metallothionein-like isoform X2 n=1 Tax=Diabrotica virgifera virgifera TaxID=50390 RepID=A0A6P7FK41_DIAVI
MKILSVCFVVLLVVSIISASIFEDCCQTSCKCDSGCKCGKECPCDQGSAKSSADSNKK